MTEKETAQPPAPLLDKQVADWRREQARLQDLIDHATGGAAQPSSAERLTNEDIDIIWKTMPGGPAAWLKSFGYQQFAKAIEDEVILNHQRADHLAGQSQAIKAQAVPEGWESLSIVYNEDMTHPEEVAYGPPHMMKRLGKWLDKFMAQQIALRDGMVMAPHFRGYAHLGIGAYVINHCAKGEPAELVISVATDEEKAGRTVGDSRDNAPDAMLQPEAMAVRLRFENVAGLDALEQQLRFVRSEHFAESTAQEVTQRAAKADDSIRGPLTDAQRDECRCLYNNLKHLQSGGYYVADDVIRKAAVYGYMNGRHDFAEPLAAVAPSDATGKADAANAGGLVPVYLHRAKNQPESNWWEADADYTEKLKCSTVAHHYEFRTLFDQSPATSAANAGGLTIDTAAFRKLTFEYAHALHHGTVPETSAAWGAVVTYVDGVKSPATSAADAKDAELTQAERDVLAERQDQVAREGYDHENDDAHVQGELGAYAAFYAMPPGAREWPATETGYGATWGEAIIPADWAPPKPGDRRRELVKAGALIVAEIERIDRAAMVAAPSSAAGKEGANDACAP